MGGACGTYIGKQRNAYGVLVEKLEGKKQLGRPESRWEDNVKMEIEKEVVG